MAKRRKVAIGDISSLWAYYFGADAVDSAKARARGTIAAVVLSEQRVLLRYPENPRLLTDYLAQVGGFIVGATNDLHEVFEDDPKLLALDTGSGSNIYVIPFRVESEDENAVDHAVALYGKNLSLVAFGFDRLSHFDSWENIQAGLPRR
jgi:hypothetical protein